MTNKVITEKWTETKSALMEGLSGQRAKSMETVLENTKNYLAESATTGATGAGNVAALNKVILPNHLVLKIKMLRFLVPYIFESL